jgi:hypothetical protein
MKYDGIELPYIIFDESSEKYDADITFANILESGIFLIDGEQRFCEKGEIIKFKNQIYKLQG